MHPWEQTGLGRLVGPNHAWNQLLDKMPFYPKMWEGDWKGHLRLQSLLALRSGRCTTGLRLQEEAHVCTLCTRPPGSKHILAAFQSTWHPFKLAATKANANRACFGGVLSVSPQSVCSSRHSFSCLIYFILKGLSICITRTGWEKVSDVCQVGFLLLFVIVKHNGLPLSYHTADPPSRLSQALLAFLCKYRHIRGMDSMYQMHFHYKRGLWGCGRPFFIIHQIYLFLPSDGLATGPFFFQMK